MTSTVTEIAHRRAYHRLIILVKSDTKLLKKTIKKALGTQQRNNVLLL